MHRSCSTRAISRHTSVEEDGKQGVIHITLKYLGNKEKVITGLRRVSKPGLRVYAGAEELPKVLKGLGIAIISTSKGVMTDKAGSRSSMSAAKSLRSSGKEVTIMSRIGKMPITVPAGVEVTIADGNLVTVKGPKGTLTQAIPSRDDHQAGGRCSDRLPPDDEEHEHKSLHGLTRTLLHNMIVGVDEGLHEGA